MRSRWSVRSSVEGAGEGEAEAEAEAEAGGEREGEGKGKHGAAADHGVNYWVSE